MKTLGICALAIALLVTVGAPRASADTFLFTSCEATGGCGGPGPYGSVTLTQTPSGVDVLVTLNPGFEFVKTGSADFEAFKFVGLPAGAGITLGAITITNQGGSKGLRADGPGSFDGDGTGNFRYGISCPSCGNGASDEFLGPIGFTVSGATLSNLEVANALGILFVADIIAPNGNTGPVDAPASEASVLSLLLASGVFGMGYWRRLVS